MKNLTPEMIEKAKAAKSAEELLEIAKANGVDMTADEAATYFAQLNPKSGELGDDELDGVAGGACMSSEEYMEANTILVRILNAQCPNCGSTIARVHASYKKYLNTDVFCESCHQAYPNFLVCYQFEEIG